MRRTFFRAKSITKAATRYIISKVYSILTISISKLTPCLFQTICHISHHFSHTSHISHIPIYISYCSSILLTPHLTSHTIHIPNPIQWIHKASVFTAFRISTQLSVKLISFIYLHQVWKFKWERKKIIRRIDV